MPDLPKEINNCWVLAGHTRGPDEGGLGVLPTKMFEIYDLKLHTFSWFEDHFTFLGTESIWLGLVSSHEVACKSHSQFK